MAEPDPRKIAVAGATGRVGRHVVDVLEAGGHDVVPISRSSGVDVITGNGLGEALAGVECVIDTATGPSPEQEEATAFFITAARNLHEAGEQAGVQRIVVVSIIGADRFTAGYGAAKVAHEQAMLSGPIPVRILRAAQFHEFVPQLVEWGRQGEVATCRRCAHSSSPPRPSPRRSSSWPPGPRPQPDPPGYRSRRSRARGKKALSRWRNCSWLGSVTLCGSRVQVTRPTRTATSMRPEPCCPARTPSSPARRSRSGWTPRPDLPRGRPLPPTSTHREEVARPSDSPYLIRGRAWEDLHMPGVSFQIRPACDDDRLPLALLFAAVAEERDGIATEPPVDVEALAASWTLDGTFVAVAGAEIVGSLNVERSRHGFGEIGMAVVREWRGRGVGSSLLAAAIEWARECGLHKLSLGVFAHNATAIALYRKFGFVEEGRRVKQYRRASGELWDAIEMGLLL